MRILFFLLFSPLLLVAQSELSLPDLEDKLNVVGKTLITSPDVDARKTAAGEILPLLEAHASNEAGFNFPFDSIAYLSIQKPTNGKFRIFTWQLYVDENKYEYFGAIQLKKDGKFIPLKSNIEAIEDPEFDQLDKDNWLGAVYYNIKEFNTKNGTAYLLFGFNGHSLFQRQKIVEVLELKDGDLQFGSPVFFLPDSKRAHKQRLVMTYSSSANVHCNFNAELDKIMFDHLIPSVGPDGRSTLVPDGSYEAYVLNKGRWIFEEKVFHQVSEVPPRPNPVLDQPQPKDIFGKAKKQK